jgi:hypothetical protein
MLLKIGVDISRLNREIRKQLRLIDNIFRRNGCGEAVVTSTYEGTHNQSSLHYCNDAIDFRNPAIGWEKKNGLLEDLKLSLGNDFDVVFEGNHYHIEYDPKGGGKNG